MSAPRCTVCGKCAVRAQVRLHIAQTRARGIALVLVLWVLTLLTVIASSFVFSSRTETLLARNQVGTVRARALADAGIERAIYELFRPAADPARWQPDGRTYEWEFDGVRVRISARDESARIDLNQAPEVLLKGLFRNAGLNDEEVARLSDAIADWRDADDFRRPNGAEARDYEAAGRSYKPANGPFETIEELRLVLNMTPGLFNKLRGSLTVHSLREGFNSVSAPAEVLYAIAETNRDAVAQYLAERDRARAENRAVLPFAPALAYAAVNSAVYNIVAQAETADGSVFIRETSVKLPQPPAVEVTHYTWTEVDSAPSTPAEASERGDRP